MQFTLKNLAFQTSMISGLSLLIIGLAGVLFAVPIQSVLLLMISAIITGLGQGLSFMGSMALVNEVVPESRRGDVVSSLYVIIYTGVGLPVIGIGFIAEWIGLYGAIFIFAVFIAILVILMAVLIPTKMKQEMTANSMT
ncbi:MFS transporter [Salibacterium halotolerans]|uniref:MFS transporter n=1 Tax=Salibacterium halotolerans TaxID=1884432 RepID=UPI001FCE12EB|nr:MFS transporter [Salibacterium halotolerans]